MFTLFKWALYVALLYVVTMSVYAWFLYDALN